MTVSTTPEGAVAEIVGSCNTPLHPGQSLSCNTNATILSYELALSEMLKNTPLLASQQAKQMLTFVGA